MKHKIEDENEILIHKYLKDYNRVYKFEILL